MLDQILTTLLSTLFGGLLAIIGSVVTNRYIQAASNKTGKQKEIRNLIEKSINIPEIYFISLI